MAASAILVDDRYRSYFLCLGDDSGFTTIEIMVENSAYNGILFPTFSVKILRLLK